MEEREFFNETTEQRTHNLTCPKCGQAAEYKVTWVVRRKRAQLPRGADERDRARFAKAQSYMVRRDDKLPVRQCPLPQTLSKLPRCNRWRSSWIEPTVRQLTRARRRVIQFEHSKLAGPGGRQHRPR